MNRSKRTLNCRSGRFAAGLMLVMLGIMVVPAVIGVYCGLPKAARKPVQPPVSAWNTVEPHLDRLDQASAEVAEKHLQRINAFFNGKKKGVKEFSEWAYSWTGKYFLAKGKILGDDGVGFRQFLQQKFQEHVFKSDDLQALLASVVEGYVTDLVGLENEALVRIRADIAQDALFQGTLPAVQSDQAFQEEYQRLGEEVMPRVLADLHIGVAGQVTNMVASDAVGRAIAPRLLSTLGLSSGGFWGGAMRFGAITIVGATAFWALDKIIDWLLDLFGYGPSAELSRNIEQSLGRLQAQLIDGDATAVANYQRLREQEAGEATEVARQQSREEAENIEMSGALGLHREFQRLHELQSRLRREALRKLVTAGGQ